MPGPNQITKRTIAGVTYWQLQHGTTLFEEREDSLKFVGAKIAFEDINVLAKQLYGAVPGIGIRQGRKGWVAWPTSTGRYWYDRQPFTVGIELTRPFPISSVWQLPPSDVPAKRRERELLAKINRLTKLAVLLEFKSPTPDFAGIVRLTPQYVITQLSNGGHPYQLRWLERQQQGQASYDPNQPNTTAGYDNSFVHAVLTDSTLPQHRLAAFKLGSTSPTVERQLRQAVAATIHRLLNHETII